MILPLFINIFSLLYTARSSNLRSHGGEISFPGGKFDSLDKNAEGAALRETEEELGLNRNLFEIWAQLPSLQGRDGKTAITPIIALLRVCIHVCYLDLKWVIFILILLGAACRYKNNRKKKRLLIHYT